MTLDESATAALAEDDTVGTTFEESSLLLDATVTRYDKGGAAITTGDRVRRRLAVCFLLHIVGGAILGQVSPRVILDYFHGNDGKASRFGGWLALMSSILQLIAIPTLCGASDVVGRRTILGGAIALTFASTLALALAPNSIVAVSACRLVAGVAGVSLPVSHAVVLDLSQLGEAAGGGEVTHNLGYITAAFGLAVTVGPVLGGALSETHRVMACLLSSSMSLVSLLSLTFYGWDETAPIGHVGGGGAVEAELDAANGNSGGEGGGGARGNGGFCAKGSTWRIVNPFSVLMVLIESSMLTAMAGVLLCSCFALSVNTVYYNYLDFRYHWNALDISFFSSTNGVLLTITSGVIIRFLLPKRLSMGRGVMLGILLQGIMAAAYGLVSRGWMLYPIQLATLLQYITEPCIQGLMAAQVDADRQGSLQGAVQSLRILAAGLAGVGYGQIFSLGVSDGIDNAFGFLVPGLPFFCSAGFSLSGLMVAWLALCKLSGDAPKMRENSADAAAEEGCVAGGGLSTNPTAVAPRAEDTGGNTEPAGRAAFNEKAAAPADATALGLAVPWPNGLGREEDPGLGASSEPHGDVRLTGLGDENSAVSDILSAPLLLRACGDLNESPQSLS